MLQKRRKFLATWRPGFQPGVRNPSHKARPSRALRPVGSGRRTDCPSSSFWAVGHGGRWLRATDRMSVLQLLGSWARGRDHDAVDEPQNDFLPNERQNCSQSGGRVFNPACGTQATTPEQAGLCGRSAPGDGQDVRPPAFGQLGNGGATMTRWTSGRMTSCRTRGRSARKVEAGFSTRRAEPKPQGQTKQGSAAGGLRAADRMSVLQLLGSWEMGALATGDGQNVRPPAFGQLGNGGRGLRVTDRMSVLQLLGSREMGARS